MVTLSDDLKKNKEIQYSTLLDHYKATRANEFSLEFRPSLKKSENQIWGPNPTRLWPEDLWTGMKRIQVPYYL